MRVHSDQTEFCVSYDFLIASSRAPIVKAALGNVWDNSSPKYIGTDPDTNCLLWYFIQPWQLRLLQGTHFSFVIQPFIPSSRFFTVFDGCEKLKI